MGSRQIDRDRLRAALRRLDEAIDLIPSARLPQLIKGYLDPEKLRPEVLAKKNLLSEVRCFEKASLRGEYYDGFEVNSKNYTEMSR